jgi:hypothetical protein
MQKAKRGRLGSFPALNSSCCSLEGSCKYVQQQQTHLLVTAQPQATSPWFDCCRVAETLAGPWLTSPQAAGICKVCFAISSPPTPVLICTFDSEWYGTHRACCMRDTALLSVRHAAPVV